MTRPSSVCSGDLDVGGLGAGLFGQADQERPAPGQPLTVHLFLVGVGVEADQVNFALVPAPVRERMVGDAPWRAVRRAV